MKRVELHIERLVLRGVPAGERDAVVARFEHALREALASPDAAHAWSRGGHQAWLRPPLPQPAHAGADWATQAGQALATRGRAP